jgi:hypothetical protein
MAFDAGKFGWTKIFAPGIDVKLPEQMTKKWWDKQKQTVAKMKALDAVEKAFGKIIFKEFNPHVTLVKEGVEDAKKFLNSSDVKKLHDALKDAKNLAKEQAPQFKKNPLTKKTASVLEEIEEVGDTLMVCVNPNSLSTRLKEELEAFMKKQSQAAINNAADVVKFADTTRKNMKTKISELREHNKKFDEFDEKTKTYLERNYLFGKFFTLARNMTQSLGNMLKASKAGVAFEGYDEKEIEKLHKQLHPLGSAQSHGAFTSGLDQKKAEKLIDKFEGWGNEYISITKDVAMPAKVNV